MPFTLAHPAAVIPIADRLGRYAVPSALVIGSVSPDVAYFVSFGISRPESHSLAGLFWFCLPVGLAMYLLFHLVLERPLVSLLPNQIARRLAGVVCRPRHLPSASWPAVVGSLFVGALTHLAWDAFTHASGFGVQAVGALHEQLFSIGHYPVFAYKVLQHCSTVGGIVLLAAWVWRWIQRTPIQSAAPAPSLSQWQRASVIAAIVGLPLCAGLTSGWVTLAHPITASAVEVSVWRTVVFSISAFGVAVLCFSLVWHLYAVRRAAPRVFLEPSCQD